MNKQFDSQDLLEKNIFVSKLECKNKNYQFILFFYFCL